MRLYDTHCHLDVSEFDPDRDAVIASARAAGVTDFLVPAIHRDNWQAVIELCSRETGCHPALGLHPVYLQRHSDAHLAALDHWLECERPVAVGEIGLDFALKELDRERQVALFRAQLKLAQQHDLPVVLHCRKAHEQILACLADIPVRGGTCHAFNGSIQQAGQYLAKGFKLGFGGMLTYERSAKLRRLAAELPLEAIVLETDAPDMTVASHRFERNSPEYLPEVLQALADLRRLPIDAVAEITTRNAQALFGSGDIPS